MDLNYRLIFSDKMRQKFVKKLEQDPNYRLVVDLDKLGFKI